MLVLVTCMICYDFLHAFYDSVSFHVHVYAECVRTHQIALFQLHEFICALVFVHIVVVCEYAFAV
jgi:hypothetical protein